MNIIKLLAVASAAFFIVGTASAQNSGTVTNNAFALGKGPGQAGFTSFPLGNGQIPIGQTGAAPISTTLSGDVTVSAAGVTAIGTAKVVTAMLAANAVTNAKLAQMANGTTKCRTTAGTGDPEDCTAAQMRTLMGVVIGTNVQAWDADLDCLAALSGTGIIRRTGAGTCSNGTAVSNAELVTAGAATIKGNPGASTAAVQDFTIQGLTARGAPDAANDKLPIFDAAAGTIKYVTPAQVAASATAGVSSIAGNTGAFTLGYGLTNSVNDLRVRSPAVYETPVGSLLSSSSKANTSLVMNGFGSACQISPLFSSRVEVRFTGSMVNSANVATSIAQARYGLMGSAPADGAVSTGTAIGGMAFLNTSAAGSAYSISVGGIITGLTPGSTYWFDVASYSQSTGSTQLIQTSCSIKELP